MHAFRKQFTQPEKVQRIEVNHLEIDLRMNSMECSLQIFSDRLNITNKFCLNAKADCTVGLFESYEVGRLEQPKEVFAGRWVCRIRNFLR